MSKVFKVKDLPFEDRPREKLLKQGASSLTDAELLAIILRTGTKGNSVIQVAQELIKEFGNLSALASESVDRLMKIAGIGRDKAVSLMAAFEISRRVQSQSKWFKNKQIKSPEDIAEIFIPLLVDEMKEKFIVICLNQANKIIKYVTVSEGILNSSLVHPREVFKAAIEQHSASVILLHNHPSGNAEPSNEDISITKKLCESGKILDIPVRDHIIIAGTNFTSFAKKGLL